MKPRTGMHKAVFVMALAALILGWATPVHAQWAKPAPGTEHHYLLTADELDYDDQSKTAVAKGNAELSDAETVVQADSLFYDENKDIVEAHGNAWLSQPDNTVMYAQDVKMGSNFSEGYVTTVGMRMTDDTRLAAIQARRLNSRYTIFDKGVLSPCLPCTQNPRNPPLWQVKAERITHDEEKHDLIYHNASLDMWGLPILYTPYLSGPDPTVKRRSGFLAPSFARSSNLGFYVTTPYYYDFSPDFDITVRPTFSTEDGFRWDSTIRKRFAHGEINFENSLVIADRLDDDGTTKQDQIRGHIKGFARFELNPVFTVGSDFALLTDKSYAQRYGEPLDDILTNRVYLEGMKGRDFGAAEFFYFQNNRPGPQPEEPIVLPRLRYSALGEPDFTLGGRWSFDSSAYSIMRDTGTRSRTLGADAGWERRDILPGGLAATFTGHVRDDVFWVDRLPDPTVPGLSYNDAVTNRLFPVGQVALQYPLSQNYGSFSHIFEPVLSITASPTYDRNPRIPDEDSQDIEFDATNLFDINRYPGTDQQEQGVRAAYGIRNAIYSDHGGWGAFLFGQGYRITDDPLFPTGTGLEGRLSDYVGEIQAAPGPWLNLNYLFRLDRNNFASRKQDVKTDFGIPEFRPNITYTFLNQPVVAPGGIGNVEELSYGFASNFIKYWTLTFGQTRDLLNNGGAALVTSVGLAYSDECFSTALTLTRDHTERTDVHSGDTIFFRIYFKHLGGIDNK